LIPFNHPPESRLRQRFDASILGMSLIASQRYWIDNLIRGGVRPPRAIADTGMLAAVVARLTGAISYLDLQQAQANPGLRVLDIDGVSSGDPRYALK